MATLPTQSVALTGVGPTYQAAAGGGDKCVTGPGVYIHVKNGGGSPITVTLTTPGTVDGLAIADRAVTVANAGEQKIPITDLYKSPTDGLCAIGYSGVTSVTVGCFRV